MENPSDALDSDLMTCAIDDAKGGDVEKAKHLLILVADALAKGRPIGLSLQTYIVSVLLTAAAVEKPAGNVAKAMRLTGKRGRRAGTAAAEKSCRVAAAMQRLTDRNLPPDERLTLDEAQEVVACTITLCESRIRDAYSNNSLLERRAQVAIEELEKLAKGNSSN